MERCGRGSGGAKPPTSRHDGAALGVFFPGVPDQRWRRVGTADRAQRGVERVWVVPGCPREAGGTVALGGWAVLRMVHGRRTRGLDLLDRR
jgi:hypothetical protein